MVALAWLCAGESKNGAVDQIFRSREGLSGRSASRCGNAGQLAGLYGGDPQVCSGRQRSSCTDSPQRERSSWLHTLRTWEDPSRTLALFRGHHLGNRYFTTMFRSLRPRLPWCRGSTSVICSAGCATWDMDTTKRWVSTWRGTLPGQGCYKSVPLSQIWTFARLTMDIDGAIEEITAIVDAVFKPLG